MNIVEIAGGTITVAMQPEDALVIAEACHRVLAMAYAGDEAKERLFRFYRAIFEVLAVAGNAQYSIEDDKDIADARLSALRAGQS